MNYYTHEGVVSAPTVLQYCAYVITKPKVLCSFIVSRTLALSVFIKVRFSSEFSKSWA